MSDPVQPQPRRRVIYPLNRHVVLLFVAVVFFALAALSHQIGHPLLFADLTWAYCGVAAYLASLLP